MNALIRAYCAFAPDGPKAGDRIAVGAVIGYLAQAGEEAPADGARAARSAGAVAGG